MEELCPLCNQEVKKKEKISLNDIQKVIAIFKITTGFDKEDKSWDRMFFRRYVKHAKELIEFLGDWKKAGYCIEEVYDKLHGAGFTVTFETICKHSGEWKKDFQEQEGRKNGAIPSKSF